MNTDPIVKVVGKIVDFIMMLTDPTVLLGLFLGLFLWWLAHSYINQ